MMKKFKITFALLSRLIGMSVITVFAIMVMIAVNLKGRQVKQVDEDDESKKRPALVSVLNVKREKIKIFEKYSGTIRPFERYQLSFKTGGRVMKLGRNKDGKELDVGDVVGVGQELAWLDTSVLKAQKEELEAARKFAEHEFKKAEKLWEQVIGDNDSQNPQRAISETQFVQKETEYKVALARVATLEAQIKDGLLKSKVGGVISKRLIKPGESVGLGQTVFEIIQVDQVKLVVGVPESKIRRMIGPEKEQMVAYVELIGNTAGVKAQIEGKVSQVAEASDEMSGLFEVEILLDNKDRKLRPGMIAISRIVVEEYDGFEIPLDAVFVRDGKTFVFTFAADSENGESVQSTAQNVANSDSEVEGEFGIARKTVFEEGSFEYQGDALVTPRDLSGHETQVIVGGQRRLVDNRKVKVVQNDKNGG